MNKAIVITSIFKPTEAVEKFSKLTDFQLIVVGDRKTPADWACENVVYLSVEKQSELGGRLDKTLPYNHYCRKMLGYLYAIQQGAEFMVDTDDDNIPHADWAFPAFEANFDTIPTNKGFVNIYELYTEKHIWPRGLPLNLIKSKFGLNDMLQTTTAKIGVWQGLADEDPDVDAIYRLTDDTPCYFDKRNPVALGKGTITPFNSQNTMFRKELFPLMYLPAHVTFRFTDILRGIVAQPIMWLYDYQLGFTNATVVQKRNPHDYFKDFVSEIPMYQHIEKSVEVVSGAITASQSVSNNLFNAYKALHDCQIVDSKELDVLEAWLTDLA